MASKAKVTLYWLEKSRSQRILWLLHECKVDYDVKTYKRGADKLADPALKKVHPLGKSPVITIESPHTKQPIVLAESGFITEYLAEHFAPHLIPKRYPEGQEGGVGAETETWLRYRFYMHYAEGSLMALLVTYYLVKMLRDGPEIPFFIKPVTRAIVGKMESLFFTPNLKTHFSFLEEQIATSPDNGEFLTGKDFTAVDILMSFPLMAAWKGNIGFEPSKYPKLAAYVERLEAMESYKEAVRIAEEKTGEKLELF